MARDGRSTDELVLHLAAGLDVKDAAALAGLSRRTAFRRLEEPGFRRRVQQARGEMIARAAGCLAAGSTEAAARLRRLLQSNNEKTVLAAARTILENAVKIRDSVELVAEMAELRTMVEKLSEEKK